jgi:hypothetical protein
MEELSDMDHAVIRAVRDILTKTDAWGPAQGDPDFLLCQAVMNLERILEGETWL